MRERGRCRQCGTRPDEWDETRGGNRWAYMAELHRCRGCEIVAGKCDQASKQTGLGRGVYVRLKRP